MMIEREITHSCKDKNGKVIGLRGPEHLPFVGSWYDDLNFIIESSENDKISYYINDRSGRSYIEVTPGENGKHLSIAGNHHIINNFEELPDCCPPGSQEGLSPNSSMK